MTQPYSRKKIEDEFTPLPLSNQRKWQLRRKRDKRCVSCGKPAVTTHYCQFHHDKKKDYAENSRKKNPLVYLAYQEVSRAIRNGSLVRQKCEIKGCERWGESHHEDYSKPLEVRWLCKQHHNEAHGKFASVKSQEDRFIFSLEDHRKRHAARQLARYYRLKAEKETA